MADTSDSTQKLVQQCNVSVQSKTKAVVKSIIAQQCYVNCTAAGDICI